MIMKVVVVKFAHNPPLTPLLVPDSASIASLSEQWRKEAGVSEPLVRLRTVSGELLQPEKTVADLPWICGYSSVEIVAERFLSTVITIGGRAEKLELQLEPTDTVAEVKLRSRRLLECGAEREIVLRRAACDTEELEDEQEMAEVEGELSMELFFYLRIFPPADEQSSPENLKVPGSQLLSSLLDSKDERLVWRHSQSSFGKARRSILAALGNAMGESALAPAELARMPPLTVNFLICDGTEAKSAAKEVWPTAVASSILPEKRKDLHVWQNSQIVSGNTFASLSLSAHEFLLVDAAIPLQLRGLSTERLQLPATCKVLQLRRRLEALLQVAVFELFLPNGKPLTPDGALLKELGPPADVEVRTVKLKVQIAYEGTVLALRTPLEVGASSSTILGAAAELFEEEFPADTLIACATCGRRVQPGNEGLPLQCCSTRIHRLALTRLLDVKLQDGDNTSHPKMPSTALASDLLAELALPLPCRLLSDGVPLAATQRLSALANRNRLLLSLERRLPVLLDLTGVGGGRRVAAVWPSEGVAALEVTGVVTGERVIVREGGGQLRHDGGSLSEQGLSSGEVLTVLPADADSSVPVGEAAFKVICYEWQVPNFDLLLPLPPSVEQLRTAVSARFAEVGAPMDGSRLVQLQAIADNGELALCTTSNVWVLCSGEKIPMRCIGTPFFRPLTRILPYVVGERVKIHLRGAT